MNHIEQIVEQVIKEGLQLQFFDPLRPDFATRLQKVEKSLSSLVDKASPQKLTSWLIIPSLGVKNESFLHTIARLSYIDFELVFKKDNITNINVRDEFGDTPLHIACEYQNERGIKTLLNHGADVNFKNNGGDTPLISFVLFNKSNLDKERILKLLVNSGAGLNSTNNQGRTALHIACINNDIESAKILISEGCDLNAIDKYEGLPLDYLSADQELVKHIELIGLR